MLRRAASARYRLRPLRARIGLVCLALALLLVPVGIASNGTHVSGTISANTTWTVAGSPYVIDGNLTVAAGVTLTVDPGVVVKFNGSLRAMFVNGTLKAVGTEAQPIVFTSIQDDTVGGDSNGDGAATSPAPGQWYHIGITAGTASEFRYATVRYGGNGSANWGYGAISVSGVGTSVTIDHATITNNQRSGIKIFEGGATVSASTISSNGNGISANQGWMALKERTYVTSNSDAGLWFNLTSSYTGPASSVLDSDIAGNGGHGVEIGAAQTLPAARFPYGNRNNIYANAAKQLERKLLGCEHLPLDKPVCLPRHRPKRARTARPTADEFAARDEPVPVERLHGRKPCHQLLLRQDQDRAGQVLALLPRRHARDPDRPDLWRPI